MAPATSWVNVADIRRAAEARAHKLVFDYLDGGSGDERALAGNRAAFDDYRFRFRVLSGSDSADLTTTLLGHRLSVPFFASPTGANRLFHTEGERAVVRAFGELGTLYSLSTLSTVSIEEIAGIGTGPKWFQVYVWKDRGLVKEMMDRARAAGYSAIVLTVDLPTHGMRERDVRNGFTIPPRIGLRQVLGALRRPRWTWDYLTSAPILLANLTDATPAMSLGAFVESQLHPSFSWADAEWLLGEWSGPAVIKGVVRADDARQAVATGFDAIMVSNHGGRQLERSIAPLHALPAVVDAVGADAEVILDGGVRRGIDILTALALGARAVSFGRPYLYGLAAAGYPGVRRALEILHADLQRDMVLLGVTSVDQVTNDLLSTLAER